MCSSSSDSDSVSVDRHSSPRGNDLGDVFRVNDGEFALASFWFRRVIATGLHLVRDRAVFQPEKASLFVFSDLTQFLLNFLDCGGLLRVR